MMGISGNSKQKNREKNALFWHNGTQKELFSEEQIFTYTQRNLYSLIKLPVTKKVFLFLRDYNRNPSVPHTKKYSVSPFKIYTAVCKKIFSFTLLQKQKLHLRCCAFHYIASSEQNKKLTFHSQWTT